MNARDIEVLIENHIEDAEVRAKDTRGSGDHFEVSVSSHKFEGKTTLEQHRMVMDALREVIGFENSPLHAIDIRTRKK